MNKQEILDIFEYVSSVDSKHADDLASAVSLLHGCINRSLEVVKGRILDATVDNRFDELAKLGEYCKGIQEIEQQIIDCNAAIKVLKEKQATRLPQPEPKPESTPITRPKLTIDPTKYAADKMEVHTLDEDFEYCRIARFGFLGKVYVASTWKEAWVRLCGILYKADPVRFRSFIGNPKINGKKLQYFSYEPEYTLEGRPRNVKLNGTDIYVWTNLSANNIANMIARVLDCYGYKKKDFAVYLRVDYKPGKKEASADAD